MKAEGHKFKGRMRENVAGILKESSAQVGRYESINSHLSPEWKEELKAGRIGISAAYEVSTATPEEQVAAYAEYKESGQAPTSKPKQPETPPEACETPPPESAKECLKQECAPQFGDKEDCFLHEDGLCVGKTLPEAGENESGTPELAHVQLTHHDGQTIGFSGDLAIIAAVNSENEHGGDIAAGECVNDIDFITLAKVVVGVCMQQLEGGKCSLDSFYNVITDEIEAAFSELEEIEDAEEAAWEAENE